MKREVVYLTGTRADFGLMLPTLRTIHATPELSLSIVPTGMHLARKFGYTLTEVESSGLPIGAIVEADTEDDSGSGMARAAADVAAGTARIFKTHRPDICLLLGDRWEMLATAMSALLIGIPIVHVCGGESSGSIDDSIRHSISKLAHIHCVATRGASERLLKMGEDPTRIHVVGAPGLVGLTALATRSRAQLASEFKFDPAIPISVLLFHPVVQDSCIAGEQMQILLDALTSLRIQTVCLSPNADAGSNRIFKTIENYCQHQPQLLRSVTHLKREDYISLLASADVLVGNSSSGIVEATAFGTPVVNVGDRQLGRERNQNTLDCPIETNLIQQAIKRALAMTRKPFQNIYGDGYTDRRIADLLVTLPEASYLLKKVMTY